MSIEEYTLTYQKNEEVISLMYLGNENIMIEVEHEDVVLKIQVSRHILEKFLEIIK